MSVKQLLTGVGSRGIALLSSVLALSVAPSAAMAAPVGFGTPSNLQLGPAPLPSSSTWSLLWDYSNSGAVSSNAQVAFSPADIWGPNGSGLITPSPNGVAIKTKGTGNHWRIAFSPPGGVLTPISVLRWRTKSNQTNERSVEIDVSTGPDNSTDNNLLTLFIDISSPRGWLFAAEPVVTIGPDLTFVDFQSNLVAPLNDTSDPSLPDEQLSIYATAIPAPGAAALLGLGGLMAARRRR